MKVIMGTLTEVGPKGYMFKVEGTQDGMFVPASKFQAHCAETDQPGVYEIFMDEETEQEMEKRSAWIEWFMEDGNAGAAITCMKMLQSEDDGAKMLGAMVLTGGQRKFEKAFPGTSEADFFWAIGALLAIVDNAEGSNG